MDGSELVHVRRAARRSQYPSGSWANATPTQRTAPRLQPDPSITLDTATTVAERYSKPGRKASRRRPDGPRPIAALRDHQQHDDDQEENHHAHLQHVRRTAADCTRPEAGRERTPGLERPPRGFPEGTRTHPWQSRARSTPRPRPNAPPNLKAPPHEEAGPLGGPVRDCRGTFVGLPGSAVGLPWDCRGSVMLQDRAEGLSRLSPVPTVPGYPLRGRIRRARRTTASVASAAPTHGSGLGVPPVEGSS